MNRVLSSMVIALPLFASCVSNTTTQRDSLAVTDGALDASTPPGASICRGLPESTCAAAGPRCAPAKGKSATSPDNQVYAGCRTAMDDGGFILYNEAFTCAREKPGAPCFIFMSGAIPDGWQTYDCHAIPTDCGVDASTQPGYPQ